jgi:tryptophanase
MNFVAEVLKYIYETRHEAKTGFLIIYEPPILRHFTVELEKI